MGNKQSDYVSQQVIKAFYEKVANDVANNIQDKGVWAQAFAKAGGHEQKAKGFYIELMVEEMILREEAIQEAEKEKKIAQIREIK